MWCVSSESRSILDTDGGIILDLRNGRFCGLNPNGAKIWRALQNSGATTQSSLVDMLQAEFRVQRCDLERHVEEFLNAMARKALVRKVEDGAGCREDTLPAAATQGDSPKHSLSDDSCTAALAVPCETEPASARVIGMAVFATIGLIVAQALLKVRGFCSLHHAMRKWPVRKRKHWDRSTIAEVSSAITKASRFCPRRVWCLERAAVTVCLLRWRGLPAKFVIGCQRVPFASHAWAEVFQIPVNEDPMTIALYRAIERC
jgi:hypothetical protein